MTITAVKVHSFVLSLPEVEQHQTWGHPTFRVRMRGLLKQTWRRTAPRRLVAEHAEIPDS